MTWASLDDVPRVPVVQKVLRVEVVCRLYHRQKFEDLGHRSLDHHLPAGQSGHQVDLAEPEAVGDVGRHGHLDRGLGGGVAPPHFDLVAAAVHHEHHVGVRVGEAYYPVSYTHLRA